MIDLKTSFGKVQTYYDGNKLEARDSFVSIRASNCLIKGKWCYEVLLLSNGLFQLGFCQLQTPSGDKHSAVGDRNRLVGVCQLCDAAQYHRRHREPSGVCSRCFQWTGGVHAFRKTPGILPRPCAME